MGQKILPNTKFLKFLEALTEHIIKPTVVNVRQINAGQNISLPWNKKEKHARLIHY
jgi:hypothetical protein